MHIKYAIDPLGIYEMQIVHCWLSDATSSNGLFYYSIPEYFESHKPMRIV